MSKVVVNSPTQAIVTLEIAADAAPGPRAVIVTTGSERVTLAEGFTIYADGPTPELMQVDPQSGTPGQALNITIDGMNTNFVVGRTDADFGAAVGAADRCSPHTGGGR